ncbi:hypothetical protein EPN44_14385 [bacterium]|nr:MAG: hypothetical protein EPN44_14385 [bacterium]
MTTPPVLRAGVVAVYSPLAPVTWLRAWFPNARVSIHDMNAPDRKRVQRAMDMVLQAWTIGGSIAVALFILSAMLMATTRKSQRVQIYGTRFWAQPDEIYASGLLVGYQPPRVERIRAALRRWTGER